MSSDRADPLSAEELTILAHEIRSPVAALSALADAVTVADRPTLRRLLPMANAAVVDVIRLWEESGGIRITHRGPVPLELVLSVAVRPGVTVSGGEGLTVVGDATRLRQAVGNVVANSIRHAEQVDVAAAAERDRVVIEVVDDGPGVAAGIDIFAKGVSGAGSSGYGLWLARSIVEAHGGTLELDRGRAVGACFRIELPLATASA